MEINWNESIALEELIVKTGEVKSINAGIHPPFSRIEIQKGGTLKCIEGSSWLMIYSKGDFILEGTIVCQDYKTGLKNISGKSPKPDNQILEVIYPENKIGGKGADSYPLQRVETRGKGALGTREYGGGGASGRSPLCRNNSCKSYDANGSKGGVNPNSFVAEGGNGGRKKEYQNGGCIYLKIDGQLISDRGRINIQGSNGETGKAGENSTTINGPRGHVYNMSPGQGGGGAPGGDGGLLVIKIDANNIITKPRIYNSGGTGGRRGLNGESPTGRRNSQQIADDGEVGNDGKPTIWLTDWQN
tara:strand:+ start:30 stop:935 length:906 start_codon:yes stop_codon:yes gene_type:complete